MEGRHIAPLPLLQAVPLLVTLPEDVCEYHRKNGSFTLKEYRKHEVVHLQEDPCTSLDIVLDGGLSVEKVDEDGNLFTVATFGRGAVVGGNLLFASSNRYPHTITSSLDSKVLRIGTSTVFALCKDHPQFLRQFLRSVSDNTVLVNEKLAEVVQRTLRRKLETYLMAESIRQGSTHIVLPVTKSRLAQMLGVSRTSVSRELGRMRNEGLLHYVNRDIYLSQNMV